MPQYTPSMPEQPVISRIAPTPSGFLHKGNVFNFLLTCLITRHYGGTLWLRIDDIDATRSREEYVEDIFATLEWLGIQPDRGASGPGNFYRHYSQQHRMDEYRKAAGRLLDTGQAYACRCSRRQIKKATENGLYPGTCRIEGRRAFDTPFAIRCALDERATSISIPAISGEQQQADLTSEMGDFVIWRKDDMAAYQLASLCDDEEAGTTLIVRGLDLLSSSAAQIWLAGALEMKSFSRARFIHHPLLYDESYQKLSKSEGAFSIRSMRDGGLDIKVLFHDFCLWAGWSPAPTRISSLEGLQEIFSKENAIHKLY